MTTLGGMLNLYVSFFVYLPYASCSCQLLLICFKFVNYLAFATSMIQCQIL